MNRLELENLWQETLRSARPTQAQFDRLAKGLADLYSAGDPLFTRHIQNRLKQIAGRTGEEYDTKSVGLETAQVVIADEVGFASWDELVNAIGNQMENSHPILFRYATAAMERGDFSALESMVGGPERFDDQIIEWYEKGLFDDEPETLAEVFSAACMLGYDGTAAYLLEKGVDPLAGVKTGLNGFHYAASSGRLEIINLLIERKVPMEIENMYGGTVLSQAFWSAVNEYTPQHAAIIEALIKAGAEIEPGTIEWWEKENIPSSDTKTRVADALRRHSNLDDPLKLAHKIRHIGLAHENAGRLEEAEKYYDEVLALYRKHETADSLDYANAVRYPAAIKMRLGKVDESARLWEEAHDRYALVGIVEGVAEAAAHLTVFALKKGDDPLARVWSAKANEASEASSDPETHKFIAEVGAKIESR